MQTVEGGLRALPVEQREACLLFTVVEVSLAEIAGVAHAPQETAKTRLRHAREALGHRLRAEFDPPRFTDATEAT